MSTAAATTKQKKVDNCSLERRPRQLKDFLLEDSNSYTSSSTGFKSFPRRPLSIFQSSSPRSNNSISTDPTANKKLKQLDSRTITPPPPTTTLQRSRSKSQAAADATISAIHKLLNYAVTTISISKSFSDNKNKKKKQKRIRATTREWEMSSGAVKVCRVKDILRWKSFRDLVVVEKQQPAEIEIDEDDDECRSLDDISDLNNHTTKTSSATTSISSSSSGSKGSSWGGDSEFSFTADELPCLWSSRTDGGAKKKGTDSDGDDGKKVSVGGEDDEEMKSTACEMGLEPGEKEADINKEEAEQNSPVSILDDSLLTNEYEEENGLSFRRSLANVERTKSKLLQSLEWFESLAAGCNFDLDNYDHQPTDDDDDDDECSNRKFEFEDKDDDVGQYQETQELNKSESIRRRAHELTHNIKSTSSIDESCERLLFDFFMQELTKTNKSANTDVDHHQKADMAVMEDEAKTYISRRPRDHFTRGTATSSTVVHVNKDMERETRWCVDKFDQEETEELVVVMEKSVLNVLVDELLVELF